MTVCDQVHREVFFVRIYRCPLIIGLILEKTHGFFVVTNKTVRYIGCLYKAAVLRAGFYCNTFRLLYHGSLITNKTFPLKLIKLGSCVICVSLSRVSVDTIGRQVGRRVDLIAISILLTALFCLYCSHNVSDNVNKFCLFFQCWPSSATFVPRHLAMTFANRSQMLANVATKQKEHQQQHDYVQTVLSKYCLEVKR